MVVVVVVKEEDESSEALHLLVLMTAFSEDSVMRTSSTARVTGGRLTRGISLRQTRTWTWTLMMCVVMCVVSAMWTDLAPSSGGNLHQYVRIHR